MKWYVIDKKFVEYLKKYDCKVENIQYRDKLKPYIGIILEIGQYKYYVPISSAKVKHYHMKNAIDLYKIQNKEKIFGVLNINNMIPIKDEYVQELEYSKIEKYRNFISKDEKQKYISLLQMELKIINSKEIEIVENARKLYDLVIKYPMSRLAKRSCDFKTLEMKVSQYKKGENMQGIIIGNISSRYEIEVNDTIYEAVARGKFKIDEMSPIVGDKVEIEIIDENKKTAVITKIFPRTNYIKRPKLANLTKIIFVISAKMPKPDLLLLDKQLVFAEFLRIDPVIIINKIDLEKEEIIDNIKRIYTNIGYQVIVTNAKEKKRDRKSKRNFKRANMCFFWKFWSWKIYFTKCYF